MTGRSRRDAARLLTFAPMIDSELARLVLAHHHVAFDERDHLFGWVSLLTLFRGGYGQVPLIYGQGLHISGPRALAEHFDKTAARQRRLLPAEQPLAAAVNADFALFNGTLGSDVAALCYYHMLPERATMIELFARSIPSAEANLLPMLYPALRGLFTLLLRLSASRMGDIVVRIRMTFDEVSRRSERLFLSGDRLTLADLAFAASAAPLVLPKGYIAPVPGINDMPPALRNIALELQAHPAAARVAETYASSGGAGLSSPSNIG